jgi:nitrate reductase cytochrome c-type subunit
MKKAIVLFSIMALVFAFAALSDADAYTLTVKSSNPSSGVAITVSPNDSNNRGNGTTEFTRSYSSGKVVSLTAPAGLTGKKFQKWTKSGSDYSTNNAITVTINASFTMTAYYLSDTTKPVTTASPAGGTYTGPVTVTLAPNETATTYYCTGSSSCTPATVYTSPLTFTSTTILRYYSKDAANNSETTKTATYTITVNPHASLTWTGYAMCLSCHSAKADEVMASQHYKWEGAAPYMVNGPAAQGKLKTSVNSYCGNIIGNWGCSACHVGIGKRPDDATLTTQQHKENIDCLICHQKAYKRKKDTLTGLMVPDTLNMAITMDQAVQTVHKPVRSNCTQCHAKGGGGDNYKRGDLAVAHGTTADRNFDVHMAASANGNFSCQKCHTTQLHKIAGRGSDLRQTDLDVKMTCSTTACHSTKTASNGHTTTDVNKHVNRVACQTCHIPKSAKNAADTTATEATEMSRDWSMPEWHVANNRWEPTVTMANDIKPQYRFWNGTSSGYSLKEPAVIDPATGKYPTSRPVGDINGTGSKLFPFKYKTAHRPYATNLGILVPIDTKVFFSSAGTAGGVDASILSSLTLMGYSSAEPYAWVDDDTYQLLTHEVPPATGNVLACANCHVSATATQMNLKSMGYATKKPTSDLCNDCHGSESYDGTYSRFTWVHSKHVNGEHYKCSRCHNFDRPERTDLTK